MNSTPFRRFGTDVSNIPSDVVYKTPLKKIVKPRTPKPNVTTSSILPEPKSSSPLFDVMETLMESFKIDDEITVRSPVKLSFAVADDCRYERDFLLKFRDLQNCKEPIEGLIAEVLPGFSYPEPPMDSISPIKSQRYKLSSAPLNSDHSNGSLSSIAHSDASSVNHNDQLLGSDSQLSTAASMEWRIKKMKKQKPREQDARRLAARQKQIDIGMNTPGYKKFTETVPASARTKTHPRIPDVQQVCSKRSWDGQVRKWRRQLHDYDPPEAAGQPLDADDGLAQNADERLVVHASSEEEDSSEPEDGEE